MGVKLNRMILKCQRDQFSLPSDVHYLNNATFGPMNKKSEKAGHDALLLGNNPLLRTRDLFFDPIYKCKTQFGQLVNAAADDIAIIPSASYGLATVAKNLSLAPKDEILVLEDQFPSNYYIWERLSRKKDCQLITVPNPRSENNSESWTDAILAAITPKTKVLSMAHVHWMDGTYFDLQKIGEKCRSYGTYFIIDGTQSVGALPLDIAEIQPDALIVASYKWLMSAYGLGFAYFGNRLQAGEPLEENWINRAKSRDFENLTNYTDEYQKGAARYSMGEQSNFISIAMANEALALINEWTPQGIQDYCKSLTTRAWNHLQSEGVQIEISKPSYHLTGLRLDERWSMQAVQAALLNEKVVVSQRGTALRISVNVYNDHSDIDTLVNTILSNKK